MALDSDHLPPPVTTTTTTTIQSLPLDALHKIFSLLPLRSCLICRAVCKSFRDSLLSPPPNLPSLPLLALRPPSSSSSSSSSSQRHPNPPNQTLLILTALDPALRLYLSFPLSFLPFPSLSPITSSNSLLYLWGGGGGGGGGSQKSNIKSLLVCNPLTRSFKPLPPLGSAWSRHGTVLASPTGSVLLLSDLAALFYSPNFPSTWLKFSLNLPSKPRSPVLVKNSIFTLCDVGSPWRSQWRLFRCGLEELRVGEGWVGLERDEWRDVFDVLKRPRLVRGSGEERLLMVGGLRASFAVDSPCSTVVILRLGLGKMEWDEAGRMPLDMYRCFASGGGAGGGGGGNNKVKVFGGNGRVWFSGKKVRGKMAMWEEGGEGVEEEEEAGGRWSWVNGAAGYGDGVYRGFVFDAGLTEIP